MSCNQSYKYIKSELSNLEFAEHLRTCPTCSERIAWINQTMGLLDESVEVPSGLVEKVLQHKHLVVNRPVKIFDYHKYLQLAAVVAIGIFLGVFLGSHADSRLFLSKKMKKDKAMIEYLEDQHLYEQNSIYQF